jgi:hypothetical protein
MVLAHLGRRCDPTWGLARSHEIRLMCPGIQADYWPCPGSWWAGLGRCSKAGVSGELHSSNNITGVPAGTRIADLGSLRRHQSRTGLGQSQVVADRGARSRIRMCAGVSSASTVFAHLYRRHDPTALGYADGALRLSGACRTGLASLCAQKVPLGAFVHLVIESPSGCSRNRMANLSRYQEPDPMVRQKLTG